MAATRSRQRCGGGGTATVSGSAGASVRAATSSPIGPESARRKANVSASRVASSSQCTSSMATSTGPAAARPRTAASTARPTARAVGGSTPAGRTSSATSSASRCGPGMSPSTSGSAPVNRSDRPTKGRSASAADGSLRSTRCPALAAAATPARHNVDLPAPGSPAMASAAGRGRVLTANPWTWRHSPERTTSSLPTLTQPSHHGRRRGSQNGEPMYSAPAGPPQTPLGVCAGEKVPVRLYAT